MEGAWLVPKGRYRLEGKLLLGKYMIAQAVKTKKWNIIHMGRGYVMLDEDVHQVELYADTIVLVRVELDRRYYDLSQNQYVNVVVAKAFQQCRKFQTSNRSSSK